MYKVADLKRLKKSELEAICHSLSLNTNRKRKSDLLEDICNKQSLRSNTSDASFETSTDRADSVCAVDFVDPSHHYTALTDQSLKFIPTFSFASIYSYFRSDEDHSTFKSIDRAVKHTSSGDISQVSLCQASVYCSTYFTFTNVTSICVFITTVVIKLFEIFWMTLLQLTYL
jgi:hypothetical protein